MPVVSVSERVLMPLTTPATDLDAASLIGCTIVASPHQGHAALRRARMGVERLEPRRSEGIESP